LDENFYLSDPEVDQWTDKDDNMCSIVTITSITATITITIKK